MTEPGRKAADSRVESVHIVRPNHLNGANRLYGGVLMQWIDEIAALAAKRHCHRNVVTASVDHLEFLKGVSQNEVVLLISKVTYVGHTSMEVRVDTYVEHMNGDRNLINRAFLTEVALGDDGKPCRVAPLILETDDEREEWDAAITRREFRRQQQRQMAARQHSETTEGQKH